MEAEKLPQGDRHNDKGDGRVAERKMAVPRVNHR